MEDYIGLDVSMKETAVSIRRDGKRVLRSCSTRRGRLALQITKSASQCPASSR